MKLVNPMWMAAIGLVALPIVFHLIRSERFQRCELATVRFLAAVVRQQKGRRRISNWPLLLVRAAAVLAVALLLARPFWAGLEAPVPPGLETMVLVDVSGSQLRRDGLDLDRLVKESVAVLPADARITVAQFADKVEVTRRDEPLRPVPGAGTDFSHAVDWAIDRRMQAAHQPGRVLFVSDFPREALGRLSPRLWPAGTTVDVKLTGDAKAWNLGIERVELLTPGAVSEVELEVSLRGSGPVPRDAVRVRLRIDGVSEPLEQTLPPGQLRARFRWKTEIPAEGLLWRGSAEVVPPAGDAIAADDARPFAFAVARPRSVLLVDGDPGESVFAGETYFLDQALKSVVRDDEVPLFRPTVRVRLGDPAGFDVVALCNIAALTAEDADALGRYVAAGGNVFFAPGARTPPVVFETLAGVGLAFGKLSRAPVPAAEGTKFSESAHPAIRGLAANAAEGWRQIPFWHALDLQPAVGSKVLAAFENGAPLLVEAAPTAGGGRALAFLHSVDRQDSEFPREPLFVPWVREVFRYLSRASEPHWTVRETSPSLTGRRAPGVYVEGSAVTVVASRAEEIDVVPGSLDEARAALGATASATERDGTAPGASSLIARAPDRLRPREFWPALALIVFVLLIVESMLAARDWAHRRHLPNGIISPKP